MDTQAQEKSHANQKNELLMKKELLAKDNHSQTDQARQQAIEQSL